jgi:hypothetical protein
MTASVATSLTNINVSAGTTSGNISAITFSNGSGVSFGLNAGVITASINPDALAIGGIAAGTQTATSGTVVYSNSNNVTFGMSNSSVITASVTVASTQASINLSAGTTSNLASAFTFSNGSGVSFGLNAGTITASVATSLTNINVSAGTTSNNLSAVTFSNSNGISFGLNGSVLTASYVPGAGASINFSAGTTSNNASALTFSNSNNVSFGLNGSTLTASASYSQSTAPGAIAAGTQTATSGTVVLSNSNNVTFGMSNSSVITASVTVASTQASINLSAGTTSNLASAFTFSNSNGVSFGLNAGTITASHAINVSGGTTSNNLSAITFSNSNGIEFGLNGSVITAALGGFSNWVNGAPVTTFGSSQAGVSFQPILIDQAITITNVMFLGSLSQGTASSASSGGYNASVGLYTLNGAGTSGSFSLASSASTFVSWTSGAPYSSVSGVGYRQISVASWPVTAGPYMLAVAFASSVLSSISMTLYGTASILAIGASGQGTAMSSMPWLPGYSQASVAALPVSFGVSNTASFIRTGATAWAQPWASFQGT